MRLANRVIGLSSILGWLRELLTAVYSSPGCFTLFLSVAQNQSPYSAAFHAYQHPNHGLLAALASYRKSLTATGQDLSKRVVRRP
jgi:hypothetical protein